MSRELGCRLHFFAHPQTIGYLRGYIQKKHKDVLTEFQELEDWDDLLIITGQVNYDHLLVIVSSRRDPSLTTRLLNVCRCRFPNISITTVSCCCIPTRKVIPMNPCPLQIRADGPKRSIMTRWATGCINGLRKSDNGTYRPISLATAYGAAAG